MQIDGHIHTDERERERDSAHSRTRAHGAPRARERIGEPHSPLTLLPTAFDRFVFVSFHSFLFFLSFFSSSSSSSPCVMPLRFLISSVSVLIPIRFFVIRPLPICYSSSATCAHTGRKKIQNKKIIPPFWAKKKKKDSGRRNITKWMAPVSNEAPAPPTRRWQSSLKKRKKKRKKLEM